MTNKNIGEYDRDWGEKYDICVSDLVELYKGSRSTTKRINELLKVAISEFGLLVLNAYFT